MSNFVKKLDDLIHQELSILGFEYNELVAGVEEPRAGSGAVVRLRPPYEDITIDEPEPDISDEILAARVRRRLRIAIEAPERTPAPPESV